MSQEKLNISIVIPVYNVSLYIERSVRSVMAQTYPVMECIIVNDASPDDSIAKCKRLIARYNGSIRFVFLNHVYNRGLSAARNTGTEAAQGDYIYYLDGDDELSLDCIDKLAKPIERDSSIEMVVGNYQVFSKKPHIGNITCEEEFTSSRAVRDFFFNRKIMYVAAWNKLISQKFITDNGLYFLEEILHEDNLWTFHVMKHLQHLYIIPDITYKYYRRPYSIMTSASQVERENSFGTIFENIANNLTEGEKGREVKFYFRRFCRYYARNSMNSNYINSAVLFKKALLEDHYLIASLMLILLIRMSNCFWGRRVLSVLSN